MRHTTTDTGQTGKTATRAPLTPVCFFAVLLTISGCGASLPMLPATPAGDDGATFDAVDGADVAAELTGVDVADDPAVALAVTPGDVITLQLMSGEDSRVQGLTVDERGTLHVPLAGDVAVGGLPLSVAERAIEAAMAPFDATVRVTIIIASPNGQRATVVGAVANPGRYTVVPGMRLADLLASAGGSAMSEQDGIAIPVSDLYNARLVRAGEPLPVSIARAMMGDPRHNVRVRAGDHLYVPPALDDLISVVGEVAAARVVPYRPGLRLTRALALAGGTTRDADHSDIIVIRGQHANPSVYRARLDLLLDGEGPDPMLAPGDVVFVTSSALSRFRDVMSAVSPLVSVAASTAIGAAVIRSSR